MFSNLPISIKLFLEIVSSGMMPKSLPSSSRNFKFGDDPIKTTQRDTVKVSKCDVLLVPCKSTSLLSSKSTEKRAKYFIGVIIHSLLVLVPGPISLRHLTYFDHMVLSIRLISSPTLFFGHHTMNFMILWINSSWQIIKNKSSIIGWSPEHMNNRKTFV